MMKIGFIKERRPFESRIAVTPETVQKLKLLGVEVVIEKELGEHLDFADSLYKDAGAIIESSAQKTLEQADIVIKVQRPFLPSEGKFNEVQYLKPGAVICANMSIQNVPEQIKAYKDASLTAFALELIPRITRAQSMDILSSQSNLAGYRAVIEACYEYNRGIPMMMTAAGTVPPARVLVLGAGVAGLQAIATAKRLGAIVSAFDVRAAAKEQVESLGAKFIEVDSSELGENKGGYANEMSAEYKQRQSDRIAEALEKNDIVITTALIPGKPSPKLITEPMLNRMKSGSVIVDMAIENGGNCEKTIAGEVITYKGIKIIGHINLASRIARDASTLFSKNVLSFVQLLLKDGNLEINLDDEILKQSILTHNGQILSPLFKE
jgi:H+-translocating NAD(P) transhydrogenase subunit alpha